MVKNSSRNVTGASNYGDAVPVFGTERESLREAHSEQSRTEPREAEESSDLPKSYVLLMAAESTRVCVDTTVVDQDVIHAWMRKFTGTDTPKKPLTLETLESALHDMCVKHGRVISALEAKGTLGGKEKFQQLLKELMDRLKGLFQTEMSRKMAVRATHPTALPMCISPVRMMPNVAKLETPCFSKQKKPGLDSATISLLRRLRRDDYYQ